MIRARRTTHRSGGSRSSLGGAKPAFVNQPTVTEAHNRQMTGWKKGARQLCPSCGLDVPLNKDGSLRGHRIGSTIRTSWPCPGDGAAPRN